MWEYSTKNCKNLGLKTKKRIKKRTINNGTVQIRKNSCEHNTIYIFFVLFKEIGISNLDTSIEKKDTSPIVTIHNDLDETEKAKKPPSDSFDKTEKSRFNKRLSTISQKYEKMNSSADTSIGPASMIPYETIC